MRPTRGGYSDATQLYIAVRPLDGVGWAFTSSIAGAATIGIAADMASNYFAQDLNPQGDFELPVVTPPIAVLPPWIRISPELECPGCSSRRFPWLTHVDDPRINPSDFVAIGPDVVQVIRPNFDAGLLDRFSRVGSGLKLFTASESAEAVERLLATERGAFVDVASGQITAVRGTADGGLASQVLPVSLTTTPDAATFSAARAELYGFSNRNGVETLTTVNTRVAKLSERPLTGVTAGTPLSATYRLADDSVYVLDRLGSSSSSPVRISRVDRTGNARDLGQIADLGFRTNLSLATTFDDQLLLTASGQAWDQVLYLVLRVNDVSVDVVSSRFEPQPGSLLLPPVANRAGGFAVATRSGLGGARFGEAKQSDFKPLSPTALANASSLLKARSTLDSCAIQTLTGSSNCAPLRSLAVYASRRLKIDDRARVRTPGSDLALVGSGGSSVTSIGTDTQLGNVLSLGSVDLRDRARVSGFLTTGGTLTRGNSVTISGSTAQHAPVLPIALAGFGADFPATNGGNVRLEPDQTRTLTAGAYADVSVKSRSTLRLASGVYAFRSLFLEPQATLSIDTSAGPVFIYVETSFTFRGAVVTRSGPSADLLIAVFGSQAVAVEAPFTGTIVAPNAAINLASVNTPHVGSFFGLDVEVFPQATVVFQPFSYPWSP